MTIETLHDVLHWTRDVHQHLGACMKRSEMQNEQERCRMLLHYLAEHEKRLAKVIGSFEKTAKIRVLNTWVREYVEREPALSDARRALDFTSLNTDEIMQIVERQHTEIIGLYRHLQSRVDTESAAALLQEVISLEEHEAFRMTHSANRLEDL